MKARKSKLIALGLAALMAVSPLSSMAYAEELLLDDGELIEEYVEEENEAPAEAPAAEEIAEEAAEVPEETAAAEGTIEETGDGELVDEVGANATDGYKWVEGVSSAKFVHPGDETYIAEDEKPYEAAADPFCVFNLVSTSDDTKFLSVKEKATIKPGSERKEPTCTQPAGYVLVSTIMVGVVATSVEDEFFETEAALGHSFNEGNTKVVTLFEEEKEDGKCTNSGWQIEFKTCDNCGKSSADFITGIKKGGVFVWDTVPKADAVFKNGNSVHDCELVVGEPDQIDAQDHNYKKINKTYYVLGPNTKGDLENGILVSSLKDDGLTETVGGGTYVFTRVPVIDKPEFNGFYYIVDSVSCTRCNDTRWQYRKNETTQDDQNPNRFPIYTELHRTFGVEAGDNVKGFINEDGDVVRKLLSTDAHVTEDGIAEEYIVLTDCGKTGEYTLNTYGKNWPDGDTRIATETKKVAAHHNLYVAGVEFASADDAANAIVTWNNGVPTVKNKECTKELSYKLVYACHNDWGKCGLKKYTSKNVFRTGKTEVKASDTIERFKETKDGKADYGINHIVKQDVYNYVSKSVKEHKAVDVEGDLLSPYEFDDTKDVKLVNKTYSCGKAGKVDVEFYCTKCHKLVETITVDVVAPKHIRQAPVKENEVAPACDHDGSYEAAVYCKRCEELLEDRKPLIVNRTPHTFELDDPKGGRREDDEVTYTYKRLKDIETPVMFRFDGEVVVDTNGSLQDKIGKTVENRVGIVRQGYDGNNIQDNFAVLANVYTECGVCGEESDTFTFDRDVNVTIKIEDIQKQGKACQPGKITLSAVATYYDKDNKVQTLTLDPETFDYYTSINAYQGKTAHNWGPVQIEKTEDGGYDEVWYCTICGEEVKREHHDPEPQPEPTPGDLLPKTVIWQLKDEGDGTLLVRWRTTGIEGIDGYRFVYATDPDFTDAKYSSREAGWNHQRRYNLERATYYVKVQTYKTGEDGKKIYSGWSGVKSIDLKRALVAPAKASVSASKKGNAAIEITPKTTVDGYQVEYTNAAGEKKTTSGFSTSFIRNFGKGTFTVKVRAFNEAEDGRYYSAWVDAGTVTL